MRINYLRTDKNVLPCNPSRVNRHLKGHTDKLIKMLIIKVPKPQINYLTRVFGNFNFNNESAKMDCIH